MMSMTSPAAQGLAQFATIVGWLLAGAAIGASLAHWAAPVSPTAMVTSVLLFPAIVLLGWMLMLPVAVLALPLRLPAFVRWLRQPLPTRVQRESPPHKRRATAVGWVFVLAALPLAGAAGIVAGAPMSYLLAGLVYGYALRHSAALQDVDFE